MGQRLVALGAADEGLTVVAALETANHPRLGEDAGAVAGVGALGVPLAVELDVEADAVIDFALPEAVDAIIDLCQQRRIPLVTATTGLE